MLGIVRIEDTAIIEILLLHARYVGYHTREVLFQRQVFSRPIGKPDLAHGKIDFLSHSLGCALL